MANPDYKVTGQQQAAYTDENNRFVEGFRVYFTLIQFNESNFINVPNINPATIKAAIETFVANRKNIATF